MIPEDLIERVEGGTGPERELDARIMAAIEGRELRDGVNWQNRPVLLGRAKTPPHDECVMYFFDLNEAPGHVPALTGSFDAAIALYKRRLPGWVWLKRAPGVFSVYQPSRDGPWARQFEGKSGSDNRALLAAILKAISSP